MSGSRPRLLNPGRVGVIARHTFTQLVRMKVFYFLAAFALVLIGVQFLDLPVHHSPESTGVQLLFSIKSAATGTMTLFAVVLGVVATALLLPKDVEDRTLYTILAKPVPRLDYLAGKLLGVLSLIFVSLVIMDLLLVGVLAVKTNAVVAQQLAMADAEGWTAAMKANLEADTRQLGPTWSLQGAVLVVFLRAAVIASVALLLSTFSTSTLFTTVVGFMIYVAGFFQADARDFYFSGGEGMGMAGRIGSLLVAVVIPDLQIYNVIDSVIQGEVLEAVLLLKVVGVTAFYVLVYGFCSWLVFARKEI